MTRTPMPLTEAPPLIPVWLPRKFVTILLAGTTTWHSEGSQAAAEVILNLSDDPDDATGMLIGMALLSVATGDHLTAGRYLELVAHVLATAYTVDTEGDTP